MNFVVNDQYNCLAVPCFQTHKSLKYVTTGSFISFSPINTLVSTGVKFRLT